MAGGEGTEFTSIVESHIKGKEENHGSRNTLYY
jgi:hypothetical protein